MLAQIRNLLQKIAPSEKAPQAPGDQAPKSQKRRQLGKNALNLDYRQESEHYFGVDLTEVDGLGPSVILALLSEIGNRQQLLDSFESADSFCAWLGLCPCNAISGGRVLHSATRKTKNPLNEALRLAAFVISRARSRLGEYCRRMKGRLGKAQGITATAHKLARILYALIQSGSPYSENTAFPPEPQNESKQRR